MNRRTLVLGTLVVAGAAFAGAYALVERDRPTPLADAPAPAGSALIRPHAPVLGPEDAPVTIVEFFDPACEACRAFHPVLAELRERYPDQVRIVMRYAAFHDGSDTAVRILEAARRQDLFEPVLEALLEDQPAWASHAGARLDVAWAAAARAGLDVELARDTISDPEIDAVLEQDAADVATVGVRQTPTFFIDGRPLLEFGAEPLIEMVRVQVEAAS